MSKFVKPPPPAPAALQDITSRFTGDYLLGAYVHGHVTTTYVYHSGKVALSVQGPTGTPAEIVDTDAPAGGKVVQFEFVRFGLMPLVTGVESSDSNVVLLDGEILVQEQTALDGQNKWFGVSGFYSYAFKVPVWVGTGLAFGVQPTDRTDPKDAAVLPPEAFVDPLKTLNGQLSAGDDRARVIKLIPKPPRP